jgi:ribosomal protein S4
MSTSSLASSATSVSIRSQNFARATNYSKPSQYFTQTHSPSSRATVSLDGMAPPSTTSECAAVLPSSSDASGRVGHERSAKPSLVPLSQRQPHDDFVHPYANPDLVVAYTPSPEAIPSHHPILGDVGESDSNSTVTDSASTRSAAFSVISSQTSSTSLTSRDIPHGNLRVNGKEISSPLSVLRQCDTSYVDRNTRFLSLHPPPGGFDDPLRHNPRSPTVTLITLQEAQARERFRSSTDHTTVARTKLPFPSSDDIPEATEAQTEEMDTAGKKAHTRARSTSAGTRHKTLPLPPAQPQNAEMREEFTVSTSASAVPGRALKHKKSGFLRLFGGRNSEGEKERSPPPPIPFLADVYAEESLQIHATGKPSKLVRPRASKSSFSPTLHGSCASNATLASAYSASSGGDGPDGKGPSSRRRQPPSLSIVTKTSDQSIPTSVAEQISSTSLNFKSPPPHSLTVPQSAPPGHSDFPGLMLRPVSTSFSSHFANMVAGAVEEQPHDVHTPSSASSSNTALSPFTPVSMSRSNDALATAVEAPGEEYLTIKGLQDQLVSAEKAWQQEIWELRGHIKDLTSELEDLRAADNQDYCEVCGRGELRKRHAPPLDEQLPKKVGIVHRPRARTGDTARFASGN